MWPCENRIGFCFWCFVFFAVFVFLVLWIIRNFKGLFNEFKTKAVKIKNSLKELVVSKATEVKNRSRQFVLSNIERVKKEIRDIFPLLLVIFLISYVCCCRLEEDCWTVLWLLGLFRNILCWIFRGNAHRCHGCHGWSCSSDYGSCSRAWWRFHECGCKFCTLSLAATIKAWMLYIGEVLKDAIQHIVAAMKRTGADVDFIKIFKKTATLIAGFICKVAEYISAVFKKLAQWICSFVRKAEPEVFSSCERGWDYNICVWFKKTAIRFGVFLRGEERTCGGCDCGCSRWSWPWTVPSVDTNCQAGWESYVCVWYIISLILALLCISIGIYLYRKMTSNSISSEENNHDVR